MKLLNPSHNPVLGRLQNVFTKHRLRSKHYAAIDDFSDDARIPVLDSERMTGIDFFTNVDQLFIVSERFADAIAAKFPDVITHPIDADGTTVVLVEPMHDDDVMYECEGFATYSQSGYNILRAEKVRVASTDGGGFFNVRNTGLFAISNALETLASENSFVWELVEEIETYEPYRPHPYSIWDTGHKVARAESFGPAGEFASSDAPPYPLEGFGVEKTAQHWAKAWGKTNKDGCVVRYRAGETLPPLVAITEDEVEPVRKKYWRDFEKAPVGDFASLPVIDEPFKERLLSRDVKAVFSPLTLKDDVLGTEKTFFVMYPEVVDGWIDWSQSDAQFRKFSGAIEGFCDLHPTDASFEGTQPIVRVAGTTLVLVHESLMDLFAEDFFYMTPLHHRFISRNLDDYLRV